MVNLNKLAAKQVQTFKADNKQVRYSDGGGLYLCIRPSGSRYWEFRYTRPVSGKNTFMGGHTQIFHSLKRERRPSASFDFNDCLRDSALGSGAVLSEVISTSGAWPSTGTDVMDRLGCLI